MDEFEAECRMTYGELMESKRFDDYESTHPTSELDAIERDMADLFARLRAAIERLK